MFYYWSSYISSPIRSATITFLRNDVYAKILALPIGYFTERKKGDLISRMTNDIYEIESSVVATLEGLIKDPLTIIGYLAYMIYLSSDPLVVSADPAPAHGFPDRPDQPDVEAASTGCRVHLGESLSVLDETLSGIRIIKGFGAEVMMKLKFVRINDSLFHIRNKMNFRRDLASPLTETLGTVILTIILYFGGMLVIRSNAHGFSGGRYDGVYRHFRALDQPGQNAFYFHFQYPARRRGYDPGGGPVEGAG